METTIPVTDQISLLQILSDFSAIGLAALALIILGVYIWKQKKNGNGNNKIEQKLKEIGNDNHHEVIAKLDRLIDNNSEQLYLLRDIKEALNKNK